MRYSSQFVIHDEVITLSGAEQVIAIRITAGHPYDLCYEPQQETSPFFVA